MRHGEVDPDLGWWMLEDPHMWLGASGPIETGKCLCEALCVCEEGS